MVFRLVACLFQDGIACGFFQNENGGHEKQLDASLLSLVQFGFQ